MVSGSCLPSTVFNSFTASRWSPLGLRGCPAPARRVRLDPYLLGVRSGFEGRGRVSICICDELSPRGLVPSPRRWTGQGSPPQEWPRCTEGARGRLAHRGWNPPFQVLRPRPSGTPSLRGPATGGPVRSSSRGSSPMNSGRGVGGGLCRRGGQTHRLPWSDVVSGVSLAPPVSAGSRALACASGWAVPGPAPGAASPGPRFVG